MSIAQSDRSRLLSLFLAKCGTFLTRFEAHLRPNLPQISKHEIAFQNEIKKALFFDGSATLSLHERWTYYRNAIADEVRTSDLRNFLRCKAIRRTMFVDTHTVVYQEYRELIQNPHWNSVWHAATRESWIGCPVAFPFDRGTSGNMIHQAFQLFSALEEISLNINDLELIFEFGGGYGCLAKIAYAMGFKGTYIIFDLPQMQILQKYYLSQHAIPITSLHEPLTSISHGSQVLTISDIDVLSSVFKSYEMLLPRSLGFALWSLGEAPHSLQHRIMSCMQQLSSGMVAFRKTYFGLENERYFYQWLKQHAATHDSQIKPSLLSKDDFNLFFQKRSEIL